MRALPKVILEDLEEDDEEVNSPVKPFLNSPLLLPHITTENCSLRNEIHDLHVNTYIPAASPSPSTTSNISKYDFSQPRIDDITIKNMIKLCRNANTN
uniref:Uncharacterized protein n=1 Tax=Heterorhabditis bacteriophora TaxID=37862 RepID=A0A1I7WEA1_HETBA